MKTNLEESRSESDENKIWDPVSICEKINADNNKLGLNNVIECESIDLELNSADYDGLNKPNIHVYDILSRSEMISIGSGYNNNYGINEVGVRCPTSHLTWNRT